MNPNTELLTWIVALALALAYAFWRSYRVVAFRRDVMAIRLRIHAAFGTRVAGPDLDPKLARYDEILLCLIDNPERFALFHCLTLFVAIKLGGATGGPPDAPFELAPPSFPPDVHRVTVELIWRVFRYMVLESLSGFVSAVVLAAYIAWHVSPMWKPTLGQIVGRLLGPLAGAPVPARRGSGVALR